MATDAFGVVAMVAMTPLIAIQMLGLVYKIKQASAAKAVGESTDKTCAEQELIELSDSNADVNSINADNSVNDLEDDIIEF